MGRKYENLEGSERRAEHIEEEAVLNDLEFEKSEPLEEAEPLMAGKNYGPNKEEEQEESKKTEKYNEDVEKLDRSITKRPMDMLILEDEREALIGEVVPTRGDTGDKHPIPVNNLETTQHTRKISGLSGSAMNLTESTAISKPEEDGDEDLSSKDLLCFAWQVARGMVSMRRGKNQEWKLLETFMTYISYNLKSRSPEMHPPPPPQKKKKRKKISNAKLN